jgi:hypothetical protein
MACWTSTSAEAIFSLSISRDSYGKYVYFAEEK